MRYFIKIVFIIILLAAVYLGISDSAICKNIEIESISYGQSAKQNAIELVVDKNIEQEDNRIDIFEIIKNQEKYTKEYETDNGEKYSIIGTIQIPKINLKYDIFSTTSETLMNMSVNRYWGADPNEVGNMCIVGHNYNDSKFFANLNKLKLGDTVEIKDSYGKVLNYTIYDKYVVDPYDTSCTSQLTNGQTEITLITCHDYGRTRLILKARAEEQSNSIISDFINKILKKEN